MSENKISEDLQKELIKVLENNFTANQIGVMKKYIKNSEILQEQFNQLTLKFKEKEEELNKFREINKTLEKDRSILEKRVCSEIEIEKSKEAIKEKQYEMKITETLYQAEKEKTSLVVNMFQTVFKNTTLKESIMKTIVEPAPALDAQGCAHNGYSHQVQDSRTIEQE